MQKSWRIFKSPHDAEVNIGRCARNVLSDACLIPLHLLLVCIRVGIDHLVSASSSLFMAFCQVLHSDKKTQTTESTLYGYREIYLPEVFGGF